MSESKTETTTDIVNTPEADGAAAPETAASPETHPAENLLAETRSETDAESEPRPAAPSDDAAHEAELAARRAAVLAGDYSAWSPDLSLSEPATPAEPQEQPPSPEAIEAVKRLGRDHHTPAGIGRDIIFHGDGYPVRGVIIGAEGSSLVIRVENGMECLVPPDIQIQYLDTGGRIIWTSTDLQGQESASEQSQEPEQPQAEESAAAEQATGQPSPDQAAEQTDPDHAAETAGQGQAGQGAQGDEAPATVPQPENAQYAGQESGLTDELRDTDSDGGTVDQPHDSEPTTQPDGEPAGQPVGADQDAETVEQVINQAGHEAEDTGSEREEPPQASEPDAEPGER